MYHFSFCILVSATVFSHLLTRRFQKAASSKEDPDTDDNSFRAFQVNYLLVYFLAVAADWVQGPYVYALYSHYGFAKTEIARLYITGFASSAVFGTFVASVADKYGRRNNALVYCITYTLSCATKHSPNFWMLLLGRILGGIAYSILFSAFEAWMVYEHQHRGFDSSQLGITFARAQFGNGIIAIIAGQVAGWFAGHYGKVMPFDVSIFVLLILGVLLAYSWTENYGDAKQSVGGGFARAWVSLLSDEKILLLGVSQAAFEGAMYTFTFVWTPALQTARGQVGEIPHGTIFSSFMAATMIGSNLFAFWQRSIKVELLMRNVFAVAALVFIITTLSGKIEVVYGGFLVFEILCGIYFPGMATMRAPYIPEESRSAILNFFRVPLNLIVVVALYEDLEVKTVFALCACLMIIAVISQQRLMRLARYAPCEDHDIEGAEGVRKANECDEDQT
ncbi:unnamed protein product [Agarophyton chilense]|eukprot:gb/GEZJ01003261.1/.p1 GENE.gb/GEZJ01003261.1/~~gb/GEZJ01003261.1/.p1  ORF type:complete len:449 (+),score=38.17 gb/GEZJ01003261.1/:621-1967(+)